jgi:sialate O-acetylesterase
VWFDHADGLVSRGELAGFEIAGKDGRFAPAKAHIDRGTVLVEGTAARYVRYAWSDNPIAVLFNDAGLPASPFMSEVH